MDCLVAEPNPAHLQDLQKAGAVEGPIVTVDPVKLRWACARIQTLEALVELQRQRLTKKRKAATA